MPHLLPISPKCRTNASESGDNSISVLSEHSDIDIKVNINVPDVNLPAGSPFKDWKEARRFAGPLPFTFTYNNKTKEVLIIEGVRENWTPQPVEVVKSAVGFIKTMNFNEAALANAFMVQDIPYSWKKGRVEKWKR